MSVVRPLDHLVLPTADLGVARARLTALGFTVAPDGVHPFGTANCCVYFEDGSFLEPLAVADPAVAEREAAAGDVFVARDKAFRARHGQEGFSAIVFGTEDASGDHAAFVSAGITAGDVLEFSRPFVGPDGSADTATFRLAFAADPGTSDAFAFTCQRVGVPAVDRSALARHANGARRISEIAICAAEGSNLPGVLAQIAGGKPENGVLPLPNARLRTYAPGEFRAAFRLTRGLAEPPLAAIVFAGADIGLLRRRLAGTGVDHVDGGGRLVVPPARGQGAIFAFEEAA